MTISGFVAYVKQLWNNKPDISTPLSAARLMHIEDGIKGNSDAIAKIAAAVVNQIANDPNKIASMAALYAVKQQVDKQNSDLANAVKLKSGINYAGIDNLEETCIVQVTGTPTTLIHIKWDANFKSQIALTHGSTKIKTRSSTGGVWKEWMEYAAPVKTQKFSFSEQIAASSWVEKTIGNLTIPSGRKITGLIVNHNNSAVLQGSVTAQIYNGSQMHICINNLSAGTQTFSGTVTVCYGE